MLDGIEEGVDGAVAVAGDLHIPALAGNHALKADGGLPVGARFLVDLMTLEQVRGADIQVFLLEQIENLPGLGAPGPPCRRQP